MQLVTSLKTEDSLIKIINKWLKIEEKCLYESEMIWTAGGITIPGLESWRVPGRIIPPQSKREVNKVLLASITFSINEFVG